MSIIGKNSLSYRKKDVQSQKNIGIGFKKIVFAHKATAGDTGINLASLVVPTEMSGLGFTNPSVAEITSANLFFYRKNLTLVSSVKGTLVDYLAYSVGSSTRINFEGFTAEDGEIFIGTLDPAAKTELQVVDAAPLISTGTLAIGQTDYNAGTPFEINKYPLTQIGAVIVYRNGIQQFRNTNNGLTGGNYYEVSVGSGLGTVIRFNTPAAITDDSILVVSNGLIAERPDGSMMAAIENIAGQLDQVIPTVAALAGVPETNFQTAPNNIDLKQFGDQVLSNTANIAAYVGENLSTLRQYNLTVTGPAGWATVHAVGTPYLTLDGTWRLRFNIFGNKTNGNGAQVQITGVTFPAIARQAVTGYDNSGGSTPSNVFTEAGTNYIQANFAAAQTAISLSGDVELTGKPSFVP